jgi:hypothetical protein
MHKSLKTRKPGLLFALSLTIVIILCGGKAYAQFSSYNRSYNKWDRTIFSNNPSFGRRIYVLTEMNLGYGAHYLDQPYEIRQAGISSLFGYRFSRALAVGLGAGLESYNSGLLAPLYFEAQFYPNRLTYGSVKPVISGATGYMVFLNGTETNINFFVNPSAGLLIPISFRSSLLVSVGVFTQWELGVQRYSFLNAKIGWLFY